MANFCYKAISAKGKTVRGLVEADTERQAIASVREKGLVPLSVESASASVANPGMPSSKSSFKKILESLHPVPKTAVAAMARQLATLLHAGLPLDEALASICAHDDASRMQGIVSRLRDRIMAGRRASGIPQCFLVDIRNHGAGGRGLRHAGTRD